MFALLATRPGGLTAAEVEERRARHGWNVVPGAPRQSLARKLANELTHFMALLLWAGGGLAFVSGTPELGWAIWVVIWINAIFSFLQGYRAEKALAALRLLLPQTARVVRDGQTVTLAARELVPGDVIELAAGDRVSADARLVAAAGVQVDLSLLTGESVPAARDAAAARGDGEALERSNFVLAGTLLVAGHGLAVVVETGARTELGGIARLGGSVHRPPTLLEQEVRHVVRVVTVVALTIGVVVGVAGLVLFGLGPRTALILAIGMIVANVPEGLLPTVTLALAMSVRRMAAGRALVRRLSAVETLSMTDLILSDKTGTLTQNEMTVTALWAAGGAFTVTGAGYTAAGELVGPGGAARADARRALELASLCCNATLAPERAGDPTELAILVAARKAGVAPATAPRLSELPFDSERRRMTVLVATPAGGRLAVTKGAPSSVVGRCRRLLDGGRARPLSAADHDRVEAALEGFSAEGLRVLAVAYADDPASDLEEDLVLAGLVAMADPPREGVEAALRSCRQAGVAVAMMTGDESATALAIARRLGIAPARGARAMTGAEIDALPDDALRAAVADGVVRVFARVTPAHKLRLVTTFQALGHTVAVTGDGVNDAPALRAASIGFAMGAGGTDVAREAADIVLLDDNFASIVHAIEEGRTIHRNVRKFISYILASNVPEIIPFVAMAALAIPPALTILQILAIDLGTDLLPALALGAEPPEAGTMNERPRPAGSRLLDGRLLLRAYGYVGLIEAAIAMGAFGLAWAGASIDLRALQALAPALLSGAASPEMVALYRHATSLTLAAVVAAQVGNAFACRSESAPFISTPMPRNSLLTSAIIIEVALLALFIYAPPLQRALGTTALTAQDWIPLAAAPIAILLFEDARKLTRGRRQLAARRFHRPRP